MHSRSDVSYIFVPLTRSTLLSLRRTTDAAEAELARGVSSPSRELRRLPSSSFSSRACSCGQSLGPECQRLISGISIEQGDTPEGERALLMRSLVRPPCPRLCSAVRHPHRMRPQQYQGEQKLTDVMSFVCEKILMTVSVSRSLPSLTLPWDWEKSSPWALYADRWNGGITPSSTCERRWASILDRADAEREGALGDMAGGRGKGRKIEEMGRGWKVAAEGHRTGTHSCRVRPVAGSTKTPTGRRAFPGTSTERGPRNVSVILTHRSQRRRQQQAVDPGSVVELTSLGLPGELRLEHDLSSLLDPDPGGERSDVEEGRDREPHGHSGSVSVGDGSLGGGEHGSSSDSHDEESGGGSSVSAEVLGRDDEDDRVLEGHDGVQDDQGDDSSGSVDRSDDGDQDRRDRVARRNVRFDASSHEGDLTLPCSRLP